MHSVTISSNTEIAENHFLIRFPRNFSFVPGQVLKLALTKDDKPRMYSISSGANDHDISILYDIVHEGFFTPRLARLQAGSKLLISEPMGFFHSTPDPAWWIAAGTGIAPFSSMFFSGKGENKTIVHGGRYTNSFFFAEDFLRSRPNNYFRCCSRDTGEGLFPGRVTDFLAQTDMLPHDQNFYLCGGSEFVVDVRDTLISRGIAFERIFAEIYF
jgi:ferredoxin--NADP+ reductase